MANFKEKIKEKLSSWFNLETKMEPKAYYNYYNNLVPLNFDGEKNPYEMGTPLNFKLDHHNLRIRSWEAFIMSDVVQNAIKKYCLWIVGSGLKLQSKPNVKVLEKYNLDINPEIIKSFISDAESQFRLYATMKDSVQSKEYNLHDEAAESLKNALLAGDILQIIRWNGKRTYIESIDGKHVRTPVFSDWIAKAEKAGNYIKDGVEINKKTKAHVAYYIIQKDLTYQRVLAYGSKTGKRQAWLMYGMKYKKSDTRGMPLLTAVLETAASMDRYKDATLKAAEENAKIPLTIEHKEFSDGSNPLINQIGQSFGQGKGVAPETKNYESCDTFATKIAKTTNKTTYNLPPGASFNRHAGSTDTNFEKYFGVNIDIVYATLGIPPEVALDKFGGAYSGSRAALKSWEYKMMVDRTTILFRQFYKPFYDYWLDMQILDNMIQAPGYIDALLTKNTMVLEAYRDSRFIGVTVPHIDPVKEVNAERLKLGKDLANIPLTDLEQVLERLNSGDYDDVIKQIEKEYENAKSFLNSVSSNTNNNS